MTDNIFSHTRLQEAMTYSEYKYLLDELLDQGKTTGPNQDEHLLEYAKLNRHRMERNEKTVHLNPELLVLLQNLETPLYWAVLAEGWCGDASQILPVLAMMADASPNIDLRIFLRDENPDIMDQYLTNGSRSIPKLICLRQDTLEVVGIWGPRPHVLQELVKEHKKSPHFSDVELKTQLHLWYAKDRGHAIQMEFFNMLKEWCHQLQCA